jgi:hypothetical protein
MGLFQESMPGFLKTFQPTSRLSIHCDADLYSATLYVLSRCMSTSSPER